METGVPSIAKEGPLISSQGKTFYYLSSRIPLRNKTGEIIGIVGISTDITSLKEIQSVLYRQKAANKEKIEFFINIAHDLKNSLGLLKVQIQEKNQSNYQALSQIIHATSEKLSDLINSVTN